MLIGWLCYKFIVLTVKYSPSLVALNLHILLDTKKVLMDFNNALP